LLSQPLDTFSHFLTTLCDVIELEQITVYADAVTLLTETEQLT
ncbi:DNA mismatch repair protein, partial [Pasteurella multocida subsp. multocida str. Anand1_cattle]